MYNRAVNVCLLPLLAAFAMVCAASAATAEETAWRISKSSGEIWVTTSGAQQVSLTEQTVLKSGGSVRTGRNGRVLLVRGQETMLISPNSVIGIPAEQKGDMSTTILQQAGTVLLEVEKRNVEHFQVETPYLAAVVKGTQFSVSVTKDGANVKVVNGQVQVSDFKSAICC